MIPFPGTSFQIIIQIRIQIPSSLIDLCICKEHKSIRLKIGSSAFTGKSGFFFLNKPQFLRSLTLHKKPKRKKLLSWAEKKRNARVKKIKMCHHSTRLVFYYAISGKLNTEDEYRLHCLLSILDPDWYIWKCIIFCILCIQIQKQRKNSIYNLHSHTPSPSIRMNNFLVFHPKFLLSSSSFAPFWSHASPSSSLPPTSMQ